LEVKLEISSLINELNTLRIPSTTLSFVVSKINHLLVQMIDNDLH